MRKSNVPRNLVREEIVLATSGLGHESSGESPPLFSVFPFYPLPETPDSLRLWLLGILLATGLRATTTRDDLDVRLAYELAEPELWHFGEARWDEPSFRYAAYEAAKRTLDELTEQWGRRPV